MSSDDYEIIDVHLHLVRDIFFEKAGSPFPNRRDRDRIETPETLTKYMARNGISKAVFVNLFPTKNIITSGLGKLPPTLNKQERADAEEQIKKDIPDKVRRHNEWACEIGRQYKELIPFIGIQPLLGALGLAEEVTVRSREGAKGVKIHPGIFEFFPNDKQLWPFYEKCQELGMPIITDTGPFRYIPEGGGEYGQPIHFAEVLRDFPRLILILAHLGSAFWDERVELANQFPNVYFDTAQGFSTPMSIATHGYRGLSELDAGRIIHKIGAERVMFGSDAPNHDPITQVEEILGLDLTEEEKQMVLAGNAKRILGI